MYNQSNSLQRAVAEAVTDYLAKYGFKVRDYSHDYVAYAESELWELQIVNTHRFASVRMCLNSEAREWYKSPWRAGARSMSGPRARSTAPIDVFRVLEFAAPHLRENQRYSRPLNSPWQSASLRSEITRQFKALAEHCRLMLEGDLTVWEEIRERECWDFGLRKLAEESWQHYTERLRENAEKAFRLGNYHEASDYYHRLNWIGDNLSFRDRIRCWWAQLHT